MKRIILKPARVNPVLSHPERKIINLKGIWNFKLDPDNVGKEEQWFKKPDILREKIAVPGCWQGEGFGKKEKEEVWDFRLKARTYRAKYHGTGWYGKEFFVPELWKKKRIWILFGGAHPTAEVWINGSKIGDNHYPMVPFGFEITDVVKSGSENFLSVRIDEKDRLYGFSWNYQGYWSGLYRNVEIVATGNNAIDYCYLYPSLSDKSIIFKAGIHGVEKEEKNLHINVVVKTLDTGKIVGDGKVPVKEKEISGKIKVKNVSPWTPDNPVLFRIDIFLYKENELMDVWSERTGFLKIDIDGKHIKIGDHPYYLRGTGDFVSCPETVSPDTDRERWRKKLRTLKEYGYNYVRCQSYVPTPEYFDIADEVGLLIQSEAGMLGAWGGMSPYHIYAWPQPLPLYREHLRQQWNLLVKRDINHPSACIYCMSNELAPSNRSKNPEKNTIFFPRIAWRCYRETKILKPSALVLWTDGGFSEILPSDFLNTEAEMDKKTSLPVIQHEFRWWSSFPDVRLIPEYNGALRHWSAEIAIEASSEKGISHILEKAAENSQKLQYIEAKGKLEQCRRDNPELAGICHFNAMDVVASPQGIINEFYEKKYADADMWLQTNGDTVILSSLNFDDRVLTEGQIFKCKLFVSDFSHPCFKSPVIKWFFISGKKNFSSGEIKYRHIPFRTCEAGKIKIKIPEIKKPVKAVLKVHLVEKGRKIVKNEWNLWIFPDVIKLPDDVAIYGRAVDTWLNKYKLTSVKKVKSPTILFTEHFDSFTENFARKGGTVFVVATEGMIRPFYPKLGLTEGRYFFTPPANYGPYEDGNSGTIIINHRMLGDFPHEGFADLQFYRMIAESPPIDLEPLGLNDGAPVIRAIHTYQLCRPLGYLIERRIGKGSVIINALNLNSNFPEAKYLLCQICKYAEGRKEDVPLLSDSAIASLFSAGELIKFPLDAVKKEYFKRKGKK